MPVVVVSSSTGRKDRPGAGASEKCRAPRTRTRGARASAREDDRVGLAVVVGLLLTAGGGDRDVHGGGAGRRAPPRPVADPGRRGGPRLRAGLARGGRLAAP